MAITLAQSTTGGSGSSTATITLGSNTTAGNCLALAIGNDAGAAVTSITLGGSAGNFSQLTASSNGLCAIWADPNCAGGQTSITVTIASTPNGLCIAVYEVSGLAASSPLDQASAGTGTSSTYSSGATATTAKAAEFWIGAADAQSVSSMTGATGWTNTSLIQKGAGPVNDLIAGYQITAATGTATYSGSVGTSRTWGSAVACLAPAVPGSMSESLIVTQAVKRAAYY